MSAPAIGDWVQGSDSVEFDLSRRGAVGVLIRIHQHPHRGRVYAVGPKEDATEYGYYKHVRRVTKAEGREVIKGWRELSVERWTRTAPVPEQIRRFLWGDNWRNVDTNVDLQPEGGSSLPEDEGGEYASTS